MRSIHLWAACLGICFCVGPLGAQDAAFIVTVEDPGSDPEVLEATLTIDNQDPIIGWAMAVCHDEAALTATAIVDGSALDDTDTLFNSCTIYDDDEYGVTCAAAVAIGEVLADGVNEIAIVTYDVEDGGDTTVLEFCELGNPVVKNEFYDEELEEYEPELFDSDVPFGVTSETFEFTVSTTTVGYDVGTGEATFTVAANIVEHADSPGNPNPTYGFSLSLAHDEDVLDVNDVVATEVLDDLRDGDGPEFFEVNLLDDGFTLGVVYAFDDSDVTLSFGESAQVADITYDTVADELVNNPAPTDTHLRWSNTLADPAVENAVVRTAEGDLARVRRNHGLVTLIPGGALFLRGDCNANQRIDVGDGVGVLRFIFDDLDSVACEDACDADDNGELSLADGLRVLNYLFVEGDQPADPFPGCGGDPTDDEVTCEVDLICN